MRAPFSCLGRPLALTSMLSPRRQFAFATATLITERWPRSSCHLTSSRRPTAPFTKAPPTRRLHPVSTVPSPKTPSGCETLRDDVISVPSISGMTVPVALKVELISPRRLRVSGSVRVDADAARVWRVLTAYPLQRAFIPNLISTTPLRRKGELLLDQVGLLSRKLRLRSRLLLRVTEDWPTRAIALERVEGRDFLEFDARYNLREGVTTQDDVINGTGDIVLDYQVVAVPFSLYPMSLVENKIVKEVPRMLVAVRDESMVPTHVPCDGATRTAA